ncbi:ribose-phosphate pyrophosphokinase [candidate division KSB1 bacterium]|nr:ribose-phosphate pyrophosphokinase [candidate division KSB1 bacterium]
MSNSSTLRIFAGNSNPLLAQKIASYLGMEVGASEVRSFSDGEIWVKYNENIRGCDVFIIQSTNAPASNILELLIMLDTARRASARRITAVIPYFGYARQDRKDQPRVAITAKLVANLISTAGADRVLTMDLHAPQIQGFFDIPLDHVYASPVLGDYFRKISIPNLVVVSPDVGSNTLARAYAGRLHSPLAIIDKRRPKPNISEVVNIIGSVDGKNVLIIDDIIDTAGTIYKGAKALKGCGAKDIYVACTHPVFSGQAVQMLQDNDFVKIVATDTIALPESKKLEKLEILTVSKLFGEAINRIHNEESISSLFD